MWVVTIQFRPYNWINVLQGFRPAERFTEDFDFTAMNEKFKKDEVWGHLGKSNKKDGEENASDEDGGQDEDNGDVSNLEVKVIFLPSSLYLFAVSC